MIASGGGVLSEAQAPDLTAFVAMVPCGSGNDVHGGLAHLVEHLLLRRLHNYNAPWTFKAFTSMHVTHFECVTDTLHVEEAKASLLKGIRRPIDLGVDDIYSELRVISVEECENIQSASIVGTSTTRALITPEEVTDFHKHFYVSEKICHVTVANRDNVGTVNHPTDDICLTSISSEDVLIKDDDTGIKLLVCKPISDPIGVAVLLNLANQIDPLLWCRLSIPLVDGYTRDIWVSKQEQAKFTLRLIIKNGLLILVIRIDGALSRLSCLTWLASRLSKPQLERRPLPSNSLDLARWRAFWNLFVPGGSVYVERALTYCSNSRISGMALFSPQALKLLGVIDV
ncbi:hypothetical protein CHUV2995_02300 [Corynebacterium diphtheriae subsp. lausannense]|nr:hypothetical protein CHUV2995_02300 [Corynebacterium diphtheriae subsp. lausannense]STC67512.1 Uncharacterised protein [Corynebacterium diphtheriae]